jgi:response regulator RpfG family c-di-GMP phosphodiesterase
MLGAATAVTAGFLTESRERERVAHHRDLLEQEVRRRTVELRETQLEVVRRLGHAAESRDRVTGEHIERIGRLCYELALESGMPVDEAELIRDASALHDLGKIGIPDAILRKPGEFTAEDRELMKTHTTIGSDILAGSGSQLIQVAELIARTHHERWDGTGYPAGMRGEEIPIEGRICSICDVFDALMSERPYKPAWTLEAALAEIKRQSGVAFDPRLVEHFLRLAPSLERERELRRDPLASAVS